MNKNHWLFILAVLITLGLFGVEREQVERFLDGMGLGVCVYRPGIDRLRFCDVAGDVLAEWGVESNQFISALNEYALRISNEVGDGSNRQDVVRLRRVLNILNDYDGSNSSETFAFCATNSNDASVAYSAARQYSVNTAADSAISLLTASVHHVSSGMLNYIQGGVSSAFDDLGGTVVQTNKLISLEMNYIAQNKKRWGESDGYICRWWPDYATSSNRYLAAQRALQVVPPPASSNYLNRVIAELEALPPGTMQLLPTNHLGTAWSEE